MRKRHKPEEIVAKLRQRLGFAKFLGPAITRELRHADLANWKLLTDLPVSSRAAAIDDLLPWNWKSTKPQTRGLHRMDT